MRVALAAGFNLRRISDTSRGDCAGRDGDAGGAGAARDCRRWQRRRGAGFHPRRTGAQHAVPRTGRVQPASRRTRDAALPEAAGGEGHRAEPQHDSARLVHDEAERLGGDDPDHAARLHGNPSVRAGRTDPGLCGADRAADRMAALDHRLRRCHVAAECRIARRVFRAAGDPRVSGVSWRGASQHLPDSVQRARHQSRERSNGGPACCRCRLRPRRQYRHRRSAWEGGEARGKSGGADGDLSQHARRVRGFDPRDLRHRPLAWRPSLHGRRQPQCASRLDQPRDHRRRRVPPEPAQDVLHSAWRRRAGRRSYRRRRASGAASAEPSAAFGCRTRQRVWSGVGRRRSAAR